MQVLARLKSLINVEPNERLKVLFLSLAFFIVIGAYTIANELKSSVFVQIVGKESIPHARIAAMFFLVPLIFFYSRLVDAMRRYQLLYIYSVAFGLLGLVFTYFLSHPTIGIPNTEQSSSRIFGWLFYFFVEAYSPFLISVFWAFANSINSPESAKKNYAIIVAGSKLGGMFTSALAVYLLGYVCLPIQDSLRIDTINHQILLGGASLLLLSIPFIVHFFMRLIPGRQLHGYEAVYQFEKQKSHAVEVEAKKETIFETIQTALLGMTNGLTLMINQPYVLGIFGMVFFHEVIYVIFSYIRISVVESTSSTMTDFTCSLYQQIFFVHFIGFIITLVGTRPLLEKLGERFCLLIIPAVEGVFLLYLLASYSSNAVFIGFITLRAINFAFSQPIRESLYIPTVKDLKFKSKSWIDAFGSKFAKSTGSTFNIVASRLGTGWFMPLHAGFFAVVLGAWFVTANLLGKRFDRAVANNEVIGAEEEVVA
jgi:AAA family ATP:ADP antiporter